MTHSNKEDFGPEAFLRHLKAQQSCATRVFFFSPEIFSCNFNDQLSPYFHRFVTLCIYWGENTVQCLEMIDKPQWLITHYIKYSPCPHSIQLEYLTQTRFTNSLVSTEIIIPGKFPHNQWGTLIHTCPPHPQLNHDLKSMGVNICVHSMLDFSIISHTNDILWSNSQHLAPACPPVKTSWNPPLRN